MFRFIALLIWLVQPKNVLFDDLKRTEVKFTYFQAYLESVGKTKHTHTHTLFRLTLELD